MYVSMVAQNALVWLSLGVLFGVHPLQMVKIASFDAKGLIANAASVRGVFGVLPNMSRKI